MATIAIAKLAPSLADAGDKHIRAVVTLLWPYSSSTRKVALLLAEPDFRLRKRNGQVRVQFTGPAARAVARSYIGIGDVVVLTLAGAKWVDATPGLVTPGKSIDAELVFREKLRMDIHKDGAGVINLDVNEPNAPDSLDNSPATANGLTATPLPSRPDDYDAPVSPYTQSYSKRPRLSSGSYVESAFDPFAADDREKKRLRFSWGTPGARWKLSDRQASPPKGFGEDDWLEMEVDSPTKAVVTAVASQRGPSLSLDDLRIPQQIMDSTLPSTQASTQYELTHIELPNREDERDRYASELSQRLAREVGGDTDDEGDLQDEPSSSMHMEEKGPASLEKFSTQELPQSQPGIQAHSPELPLPMPPPTLPALQTSEAFLHPTSRLMAPQSGLPKSPLTPELHPLQSAALPLPSPFPGEQLEQTPFFPPQRRDFRSPSSSGQIGIVPDSMFQFGFGLDGAVLSSLSSRRTSGVPPQALDEKGPAHLPEQQHPKSPPPPSPARPSEGHQILRNKLSAFEAPSVGGARHQSDSFNRRGDEVEAEAEIEEKSSVLVRKAPISQHEPALQQSQPEGPVVIDLLDSSSSSSNESEGDSEGEEEIEVEEMSQDEQEASSEIEEADEIEDEDADNRYHKPNELYEEEEVGDEYERSDEESDEDSDVEEHEEEEPVGRYSHRAESYQESASARSMERADSEELYRNDFPPPISSRAETTVIDLTSDTDDEQEAETVPSTRALSQPESMQPVAGRRQQRRRLHASQGQGVHDSTAAIFSQSGSYLSKLVVQDTFEDDVEEGRSIFTELSSDQPQEAKKNEPEDDDMGGTTPKASTSGDVHYPELPSLDEAVQHPSAVTQMQSAAAGLELLRSSPSTRPQSLPIWDRDVSTHGWAQDQPEPFATHAEIPEGHSFGLPKSREETMREAQIPFGTNEWLGIHSSPPAKAPADEDPGLFADVNLSPQSSPAVASASQHAQQAAQQDSLTTTSTSVVPDSIQPSQQRDATVEGSNHRARSPAPEMEQVSDSGIHASIIDPILAHFSETQQSPSTQFFTAREAQEPFTQQPPATSQESFTLRASEPSQPSQTNGVHPPSPNGVTSPTSPLPSAKSTPRKPKPLFPDASPPSSLSNRGLRTPLSYYTPLSQLRPYLNRSSQFDEVDVLAVVCEAASEPKKAPRGPRHWFTQFRVVDGSVPLAVPALDGDAVGGEEARAPGVRVQCFRGWKDALPLADVGDVVLLRQFEVVGAKDVVGVGVKSSESSGWCVWRFGGAGVSLRDREQVRGPPVEVSNEEREEVRRLKGWFDNIVMGEGVGSETVTPSKERAKI